MIIQRTDRGRPAPGPRPARPLDHEYGGGPAARGPAGAGRLRSICLLHFDPLRFILCALFVPAILLSDGSGLPRHVALGVATAAFLWFLLRRSTIAPGQIAIAIVVATTGEIILSMGWGLYSYRFTDLVPLYVPFGHGVFYLFAAETARQRWAIDNERRLVGGVLIGGSCIALLGLIFFRDEWGLLWWIVAAALIAVSKNPRLVSICFIYTMLLEWAGTAIGNWRWAAEVPYVGLTSGNPPSGVGVLYIILDVTTIALSTALWSRDRATDLSADCPPVRR